MRPGFVRTTGRRSELNMKEGEVVHPLGFNTVRDHLPEFPDRFDFGVFSFNSLGTRLDPAMASAHCRKEVEATYQWLGKRFGANASRVQGLRVSNEVRATACARRQTPA